MALMRLMTFRYAGQDHAGVLTSEGLLPILEINAKHDLHLPNSLLEIIRNDIRDIPVHGVRPIPLSDSRAAAALQRPTQNLVHRA